MVLLEVPLPLFRPCLKQTYSRPIKTRKTSSSWDLLIPAEQTTRGALLPPTAPTRRLQATEYGGNKLAT